MRPTEKLRDWLIVVLVVAAVSHGVMHCMDSMRIQELEAKVEAILSD